MTIYEASISFFSPDPVSPAPITLTTRQGDWFHRAVPVTNTSNGVAAEIKVTGVRSGETWNPIMNKVGLARVPKAAETFTYDFDGNMTGDSLWTYQWDGENRLIRVTSKLLTGDHAYRDETFTYDYANRMTRQQVSGWEPYLVPNTTETWVWIQVQYRRYFVWQGWNIVAELEERKPANGDFTGVATLLRRNVWGLDLSGSLQGAGGVGGLLAVQNHATDLNGQLSSATSTPVYDGNGNILAYHNLINGVKVADFAYGPFGEPLKAYGEAAKNHPFRFSTKYTDDETGLVLYQLRPSRPDLGRWLQKDRIWERGGVNLYGFLGNYSGGSRDYIGNQAISDVVNDPTGAASDTVENTSEAWGNVSPAERDWCKSNPICCAAARNSRDHIFAEMQSRYPNWRDGSVENAVQHCAWMCYVKSLTCCSEEDALELGDAHEEGGSDVQNTAMDYHNNSYGLKTDGNSVQDCFNKCEAKARGGELYWYLAASMPGRNGLPADFPGFSLTVDGIGHHFATDPVFQSAPDPFPYVSPL